MREIVLDLETTGLSPDEGHRITEVGAVELVDGKPTGKEFHAYVNPERDVPEFIEKLTGLSTEFLSDKPLFAEIAKDLQEFIGDAPIIITCRTGDDGTVLDEVFLNKEMKEAGMPAPESHQWVNIRKWSEQMYGNDEARLDAVLDRFEVDKSEREDKGHGALLDAQLLAEVYPKVKSDWFESLKSGKVQIRHDNDDGEQPRRRKSSGGPKP